MLLALKKWNRNQIIKCNNTLTIIKLLTNYNKRKLVYQLKHYKNTKYSKEKKWNTNMTQIEHIPSIKSSISMCISHSFQVQASSKYTVRDCT